MSSIFEDGRRFSRRQQRRQRHQAHIAQEQNISTATEQIPPVEQSRKNDGHGSWKLKVGTAVFIGAAVGGGSAVVFSQSGDTKPLQQKTEISAPHYTIDTLTPELIAAARAKGYTESASEKDRWRSIAFSETSASVDRNDPSVANARVLSVLSAMPHSENAEYREKGAYLTGLLDSGRLTFSYVPSLTDEKGRPLEMRSDYLAQDNEVDVVITGNALLLNAPPSILKPADVADMLTQQASYIFKNITYMDNLPADLDAAQRLRVNRTRLADSAERLSDTTTALADRAQAHIFQVGLTAGDASISGIQSSYLSGINVLTHNNLNDPTWIGVASANPEPITP